MGFDLHDVSFAYEARPVFNALNLSLAPGLFYGIIGPNGCGKTTLLDLLAGLRPVASGSVRYGGTRLQRFSRQALARKIALVPQDFQINFGFSAEQVVMMGRYPHLARFCAPSDEDRRQVAEVMAETGADRFQGRRITELSGGEKQRVVFARALAQDTPVLLLDEATSNLDINHALTLLACAARRVREERRTVIAVFQDINLAAAYCQHLVCLQAGQVVAQGPTETVLTPDLLQAVFGVEAKVYREPFNQCHQVVYKRMEP